MKHTEHLDPLVSLLPKI